MSIVTNPVKSCQLSSIHPPDGPLPDGGSSNSGSPDSLSYVGTVAAHKAHIKQLQKKLSEKALRSSRPLERLERKKEGEKQGLSEANPLLYLYSNNSIENPKLSNHEESCVLALCGILSPYYKKAAHTLHANVSRLISLAPSLGHIGFLTLTFPDNVTEYSEAYKRFRSMNTNFLANSSAFGHWVCVKERQERGAWHYHLVVICTSDIRKGFDFDEYKFWMEKRKKIKSRAKRIQYGRKATKSASPLLRSLWSVLRCELSKYGFGRSELLPIHSTSEAISRYIGKYISKAISKRDTDDTGVRLVNYSKGWSKNSVRFQWFTENSQKWRKKVAIFAALNGCENFCELSEKLGPDWAYCYSDYIFEIDETDSIDKINTLKSQTKKHVNSTLLRVERGLNERVLNRLRWLESTGELYKRQWQFFEETGTEPF